MLLSWGHQVRHEALFFVDKLFTLVLKLQNGIDLGVAVKVRCNDLAFDKAKMFCEVKITIGEKLRI